MHHPEGRSSALSQAGGCQTPTQGHQPFCGPHGNVEAFLALRWALEAVATHLSQKISAPLGPSIENSFQEDKSTSWARNTFSLTKLRRWMSSRRDQAPLEAGCSGGRADLGRASLSRLSLCRHVEVPSRAQQPRVLAGGQGEGIPARTITNFLS